MATEPLFHVVLYEPQIAPNTGNIMRLCANAGSRLHLVGPLGFELDDRRLRRAGLGYGEWAEVRCFDSLADFYATERPCRLFACTTRTAQWYARRTYRRGDYFLFGSETRGLPPHMLGSMPAERKIRIPMVPASRCLNLSNAAAIVLYEAWRQLGFADAL